MASLDCIGGIHYEMMKRCYNSKSVIYKCYGAKGITVCKEWHDRENFRKWAYQNGYIKGLRLERIDTKGNYEPKNCKFGEKHKNKGGNEAIRKKRIDRKNKYKEHGIDKNITSTPCYKTYYGMITRCYNKNHESYEIYGGRGITVCPEWLGKNGFLNFNKWAVENGWSKELTLDRIDNNKGYSPDNCRWVTRIEQIKNRRNMKLYDYYGETLCLKEIANKENLNYGKLYRLIKIKKIDIKEAVECLK